MDDTPKGRCVLSGALTTGRLPNGDFMCPEYIEGLRSVGDLDERFEYTDAFFRRNKHLKKVILEGRVYAITELHLILQNIIDVFQIEGRGTVVTGEIAAGWKLAKRGDGIVLRTPDGRTLRTTIKDMELFSKGKLTPEPIPTCGVLLASTIPSDQLPRGTQMLRVPLV